MLEQGLIVEKQERPAPELDDERRRYYRITPLGAAVAKAEATRISKVGEMGAGPGIRSVDDGSFSQAPDFATRGHTKFS
jgi:DNA-binding PadR family transcriptional regulator